jgi:hypothetical protein
VGLSKKPKLGEKQPPASSDGRPGVWLDDDTYWVQVGDHVFMEVACSKKTLRDPASFKVAAGGALSSSSSSSRRSGTQRLVWLFREEHLKGRCVHARFYENAARSLAQPLDLQRRTQQLCSDKISGVLQVLQPDDPSVGAELETLTAVEAEWLQAVHKKLSAPVHRHQGTGAGVSIAEA